jgi:hypothetical protein
MEHFLQTHWASLKDKALNRVIPGMSLQAVQAMAEKEAMVQCLRPGLLMAH